MQTINPMLNKQMNISVFVCKENNLLINIYNSTRLKKSCLLVRFFKMKGHVMERKKLLTTQEKAGIEANTIRKASVF